MKKTIRIDGELYELEIPDVACEGQFLREVISVEAGGHTVSFWYVDPENEKVGLLIDERGFNVSDRHLGDYYACSRTGALFNFAYDGCKEGDVMREEHVCFHAAFWMVRARDWKDNPYWFRVEGVSYACDERAICRNRKPRDRDSIRGFGGRKFRVVADAFPSEILVIDDLWHQGDIPEWLGLEDNAVFLRD